MISTFRKICLNVKAKPVTRLARLSAFPDNHQNGRRNNDKWVSYVNGAKPKQQGKRTDLTSGHNVRKSAGEEKKDYLDRDFREACDAVEAEQGESVLETLTRGRHNAGSKAFGHDYKNKKTNQNPGFRAHGSA